VCLSRSFDECSSNSSDDVDDDSHNVDVILDAADDSRPTSSGSNVLTSSCLRQTNPASSALRTGLQRTDAGAHVLGNGWKKYYIDPADVAARQQNDAAVVVGGRGAAPFERGSSQRVTLPLAAGVRESTAAGGSSILVKRCEQSSSGLQRVQPGRRSSRDGVEPRVSTFGGACGTDSAEVNAECRTPTVGFALPVSLAVRPQPSSLLTPGRPGSGGGKTSGLLTPSSRRAAADAQRGERLSNYRHSTLHRRTSAESETETTNDDNESVENPEEDERPASPAYDCSDDMLEDRSSSSPDEEANTKLGSRCSLTDWNNTTSSSAIVQDGGQGPAQPSLYPASRSSGSGCHDYVNVNYLLSSRGVVAARPDSSLSTGSARSPWVRGSSDLGRMAMSETESIENLTTTAAWPSYGTDPLQRSDSFRSATSGDASKRPALSSSSSLPRYGSMAQMWRDQDGAGAGPCLATFRFAVATAAGQTPFSAGPTAGNSPRSSAVSSASPSASSVFAHKSRLSASKDNNRTLTYVYSRSTSKHCYPSRLPILTDDPCVCNITHDSTRIRDLV